MAGVLQSAAAVPTFRPIHNDLIANGATANTETNMIKQVRVADLQDQTGKPGPHPSAEIK